MAMEDLPVSTSNSVYKVTRKIKRRDQSLYNALRSIYQDSLFVGEIRSLWSELPVLANLRCGLWYSPNFDGTCYFKSTDGHTGNWSFNPSRLNMHVAMLAAQRGGCFIVDATRRGKRFPDSFSKTIPIWACVLNRSLCKYHNCMRCQAQGLSAKSADTVSPALRDEALWGDLDKESASKSCVSPNSSDVWDCTLHLPLWVSDTEKESIQKLIDEWVNVLRATNADLASLAGALKKPLQPLWISQSTLVWLNEVPDVSSWSFTPVILVSASQSIPSALRVSDGDFGWNYIPGAADDEESWARGLSPALFWKNAISLIRSSADECNRMVADIVERERVSRACRGLEASQVRVKYSKKVSGNGQSCCAEGLGDVMAVSPGSEDTDGRQASCVEESSKLTNFSSFYEIEQTGLAVGSISSGQLKNSFQLFDGVINCGVEVQSLPLMKEHGYLYLPVVVSKYDRFSLQASLPRAISYAKEKLKGGLKILIFCSDGEDLSVCVCLAILLALFNREGVFEGKSRTSAAGISKWEIRQCLVYLCKFAPNARPSRGNLKQVYNALLSSSASSD